MPEIIHDFFVKAPPERVYEMFTVSSALDRWWTRESSGEPKLDGEYRLYFISARRTTGARRSPNARRARSSNCK